MTRDWALIKSEYINDRSSTAHTLSQKYGIPRQTICSQITKGGWVTARESLADHISHTAITNVTAEKIDIASQFCAEDLKVSIDLRSKIARLLPEVTLPSEINALAAAADKAQKIGRLALGLTTSHSEITSKDDPLEELAKTREFLASHGISVDSIH